MKIRTSILDNIMNAVEEGDISTVAYLIEDLHELLENATININKDMIFNSIVLRTVFPEAIFINVESSSSAEVHFLKLRRIELKLVGDDRLEVKYYEKDNLFQVETYELTYAGEDVTEIVLTDHIPNTLRGIWGI